MASVQYVFDKLQLVTTFIPSSITIIKEYAKDIKKQQPFQVIIHSYVIETLKGYIVFGKIKSGLLKTRAKIQYPILSNKKN